MAANLVVTPAAQQDMDEAYDWFERQQIGQGERFLTAAVDYLNLICRTPTAHRLYFRDYRRSRVPKWPYAVRNTYDGGTVIVYCVYHTARDPNALRQRLSE